MESKDESKHPKVEERGQNSSSLSVDTHCTMIAGYMSERTKDMHDAFRQFLQLYSAILGGSLLLRLQYDAAKVQDLEWYLDALLVLAAAVATFVMRENFRAWKGYRLRLHELAGVDAAGEAIIPRPIGRASWVSRVYYLTVWLSALGLMLFNPFR